MTAETVFPRNSENIHSSIIFLILTVENKSRVFIFSYLFTGENGKKKVTKHVHPLYRKKKNGKSKIDIDLQFLFFLLKLNERMTHGPKTPPVLRTTFKIITNLQTVRATLYTTVSQVSSGKNSTPP